MTKISAEITFDEFMKVDIRAGTIVKTEEFPEARKPAIKMIIDFGDTLGLKKTSAQITDHYAVENLVGKQVSAVVNFPPRQIGPFMSKFLFWGWLMIMAQYRLYLPIIPCQTGLA